MSKVVFFLLKLKPEVAKDDFERWVREVDYPTAASVDSIISYRVHRLEGPWRPHDAVPYDYLERVEVRDFGTYRNDLDSASGRELGRQWREYVAESTAWAAEEIAAK